MEDAMPTDPDCKPLMEWLMESWEEMPLWMEPFALVLLCASMLLFETIPIFMLAGLFVVIVSANNIYISIVFGAMETIVFIAWLGFTWMFLLIIKANLSRMLLKMRKWKRKKGNRKRQ